MKYKKNKKIMALLVATLLALTTIGIGFGADWIKTGIVFNVDSITSFSGKVLDESFIPANGTTSDVNFNLNTGLETDLGPDGQSDGIPILVYKNTGTTNIATTDLLLYGPNTFSCGTGLIKLKASSTFGGTYSYLTTSGIEILSSPLGPLSEANVYLKADVDGTCTSGTYTGEINATLT